MAKGKEDDLNPKRRVRLKIKVSQITDPAQRVLAGKVSEVCDIFFAGFASLPPEERLLDAGRADGAEGRVRNMLRMLAVGAVVHLGRELGIAVCNLYGKTTRSTEGLENAGGTQVPFLVGLHRNTCYSAQAAFAALTSDRGDFGVLVEERFGRVLRAAREELAEMLAKDVSRSERAVRSTRKVLAKRRAEVRSAKKRAKKRT